MVEQDIYSIGEASLITGITTKALRYYDSLHLVVPEKRDPHNRYRYYSRDQVISLIIIQRLRLMGCSLKQLQTVMEKNDLPSLYQAMLDRVAELHKEIEDCQAIIDNNASFIHQLEEAIRFHDHDGSSGCASENCRLLNNVKIEEIPVSHIFCEERIMPHYHVADTSVNFRVELYKKCVAMGLQMLGPEITTYYTNLLGQFVAGDCKIRIGIVVKDRSNCKNIQTFGGFTAATAVHFGSYDSMVNTHMMLLQWINQKGYTANGYVSEEFMVSPINLPTQKDQIIKVIIPVSKIE